MMTPPLKFSDTITSYRLAKKAARDFDDIVVENTRVRKLNVSLAETLTEAHKTYAEKALRISAGLVELQGQVKSLRRALTAMKRCPGFYTTDQVTGETFDVIARFAKVRTRRLKK